MKKYYLKTDNRSHVAYEEYKRVLFFKKRKLIGTIKLWDTNLSKYKYQRVNLDLGFNKELIVIGSKTSSEE